MKVSVSALFLGRSTGNDAGILYIYNGRSADREKSRGSAPGVLVVNQSMPADTRYIERRSSILMAAFST